MVQLDSVHGVPSTKQSGGMNEVSTLMLLVAEVSERASLIRASQPIKKNNEKVKRIQIIVSVLSFFCTFKN